jgi:hypothetical protein
VALLSVVAAIAPEIVATSERAKGRPILDGSGSKGPTDYESAAQGALTPRESPEAAALWDGRAQKPTISKRVHDCSSIIHPVVKSRC